MEFDSPRSFATTRWTLVAAAADQSSDTSRAALEELCEQYWVPLYAFALRRGLQVNDAQDLTQDFFAYLLGGEFLSRAEAGRGRFRSFLLTAFDRYATSQWRRDNAKKRGGHMHRMSLDFGSVDQHRMTNDQISPELAFRQQWAVTLLAQVVKRLTEEYEASGQSELFKQLEHHWNASVPAKPHGEVAETLNMAVAAVNVAAHRLRQRYRTVLREIVGDTVESPDEVEDEIRDLMNSFGNRS